MNEQSIYYQSPIGVFRLTSDGEHLTCLHFCDEEERPDQNGSDSVLVEAVKELDEYFAGIRTEFTVPVRFIGTEFQVRAWEALQKIPFGQTVSYRWQADRIGSGARAVGLANGRNPVAVIVPCHRVIGANGSLTGYGGGLWRKQILLNFESTVATFGPCRLEELLPRIKDHGTLRSQILTVMQNPPRPQPRKLSGLRRAGSSNFTKSN